MGREFWETIVNTLISNLEFQDWKWYNNGAHRMVLNHQFSYCYRNRLNRLIQFCSKLIGHDIIGMDSYRYLIEDLIESI